MFADSFLTTMTKIALKAPSLAQRVDRKMKQTKARDPRGYKVQKAFLPPGAGAAYSPETRTIYESFLPPPFGADALLRHEVTHAVRHHRGKWDVNDLKQPNWRNVGRLMKEEAIAYHQMHPSLLGKIVNAPTLPLNIGLSTIIGGQSWKHKAAGGALAIGGTAGIAYAINRGVKKIRERLKSRSRKPAGDRSGKSSPDNGAE